MEEFPVVAHLKKELVALEERLKDAETKLDQVDALHTAAYRAQERVEMSWLEHQMDAMVNGYRNYFKALSNDIKRRLVEATSFGFERDALGRELIEFNLKVDMIGVDKKFWSP